jgi:hypothetical protein
MKNIKFLVPLVLLIVFQACKHNSDNATPLQSFGTLKFHIHTNIDTNEAVIDSNVYYKTDAKQRITFNRVRYYISNIKAFKADGTYQKLSNDTTLLINAATETYTAGKLASGNYTYVSFNIGLTSTDNGKNPSQFGATDARSAQNPSMYYGNTKGYYFMDIAGAVDTSASQTDTTGKEFLFQITADATQPQVQLPEQKFTMITGKQWEVHLRADFGKLLDNINLKTNSKSTPDYKPETGFTLIRKMPDIFTYEK